MECNSNKKSQVHLREETSSHKKTKKSMTLRRVKKKMYQYQFLNNSPKSNPLHPSSSNPLFSLMPLKSFKENWRLRELRSKNNRL